MTPPRLPPLSCHRQGTLQTYCNSVFQGTSNGKPDQGESNGMFKHPYRKSYFEKQNQIFITVCWDNKNDFAQKDFFSRNKTSQKQDTHRVVQTVSPRQCAVNLPLNRSIRDNIRSVPIRHNQCIHPIPPVPEIPLRDFAVQTPCGLRNEKKAFRRNVNANKCVPQPSPFGTGIVCACRA